MTDVKRQSGLKPDSECNCVVASTAIFGIVFLIFRGRNLAGRAISFDALNMDAFKNIEKRA
jgi:hypothetical protein